MTFGDPPGWNPLPDPLPPGRIRIPVSFAVYLPVKIIGRRTMREGWSPALAEAMSAQISIVPHSLRLGTGPRQDGDRTWQDFDALHDGSASPAPPPVDNDMLVAAERRDPHPVLPVPAPRVRHGTRRVRLRRFPDFMGDPDRHPSAPPPWPAAHGPGPGKSARTGAGGMGTADPVSEPLAVLPKVTAVGEMGLGAAMTAVGTGETVFGVATTPEVIGVPIAAEGIATTGAGINLYEDGLRLYGNTPEPLRAYSFHLDLPRAGRHPRGGGGPAPHESEIVADVAPDDSLLFRTVIVPTAPGQPLDPARDGIALLRVGERVPKDYAGLPPTPWAPFAWRRTPDALEHPPRRRPVIRRRRAPERCNEPGTHRLCEHKTNRSGRWRPTRTTSRNGSSAA